MLHLVRRRAVSLRGLRSPLERCVGSTVTFATAAPSAWAKTGPVTAALEHLKHFPEFAEVETACPRGASLKGGSHLQRSGAAAATASRGLKRISEVAATIPGELGAAMLRAAGRRASAVYESSLDAANAAKFADTVGAAAATAMKSAASSSRISDAHAVAAAAAEVAEDALAAARTRLAVSGTPAEATAAAVGVGIAACEAALPGGGDAQWVRPSAFESDVPRVAAYVPLVVAGARLHGVAAAAAALSPAPEFTAADAGAAARRRGSGTPAAGPATLAPAVGAHAHAGVLLATHIGQCAGAVARHVSDPRNGTLDVRGSALSLALHAVAAAARASVQRNVAAALILTAWRASLGGGEASGAAGGMQSANGPAGALAAAHTVLEEELRSVDEVLASYEHFKAHALPPAAQAALVRIASDAALHRVALLSSLAEVGWAIALSAVPRTGGGSGVGGASLLVGMSEADADAIAPLLRGVRGHAERALAFAERIEVASTAADCPGAHAFAGKAAAAAAAAAEQAPPPPPRVEHAQPHELGWRWSDYGPDPGAGVARPLRVLAGLHALGGSALLAEGLLTTCIDRHATTFCLPAAQAAAAAGTGPHARLHGLPPLQRVQAGASLQSLAHLLAQVERRGAEAARLLAAGDSLQAGAARALGLLPPPPAPDAAPPPALGDRHLLAAALGALHVGGTAAGSLEADLAAVVGAL